ncbi:MAG: PEP-CTERM sorting domain-containing protein [Kiritimatiellae bacterium]|nr:PEP-CTERM sorting domain-containing protein [Kiritimatiellia bacterium]
MTLKKIATAAFVALAVMSARAEDSYLFWMIEQSPTAYSATQYDYATISQDGVILHMYAEDAATGSATDLGTEVVPNDGGYSMDEGAYARLNSVQGGSFLVELWRDGVDERVGYATYDWASIEPFIVDTFNQSGGIPLSVTQPDLVPEPSGGLLILVGLAGLALRRRRARKSEV